MKVRRADRDDLPALIEFTEQEAIEAEGATPDRAVLEKGIGAALDDPALAMYWVLANDRGLPVGSISALTEWSDWNAGHYWWIQSIYVTPEHRGRGLVSLLVGAVEAEMVRQGGLELRLYVHRNNARAVRAYEKLGFEAGSYEVMQKRGER